MSDEDRARDELADDLRAVIETIATVDVDDGAIERARQLVAELHAVFADGAPALRWHQVDFATHPERVWRIYRQHSPLAGGSNPLMVTKTTRIVTGDDGSKQVEDRLVLGNAYEGPPRAVHGGIVAALFDELLGSLQRVAGLQAYTGELTIRYRALTPLHEELVFLGWIDDVRGRLIKARATCRAADTLTAEATALFIGIDLLAETGQRQAAAPSTRHRRLD